MEWNYNMEACPWDEKVWLLSAPDDESVPQQAFLAVMKNTGGFMWRGTCFEGDEEAYNKCRIVAWRSV